MRPVCRPLLRLPDPLESSRDRSVPNRVISPISGAIVQELASPSGANLTASLCSGEMSLLSLHTPRLGGQMLRYSLSGDPDGSSQALWEDGERVFRRGWRTGDDGDRSAVLVVMPAAEHPSRSSLDRIAHEFALKDELDGQWAVRPLELVSEGARPMLVLEDTGGEALHRLLGAPMEVGGLRPNCRRAACCRPRQRRTRAAECRPRARPGWSERTAQICRRPSLSF
jgi:hypothetical protein